ncbi:FG-GAP-like repeat-containing protein [Stieleria sp. TO1_6]|uniref:FG-GAP-like repeat-containing protein n=1 Tax=Stieleria tagensis TaxID=2956795 RepID=UPI00209BA8C4|nr:FG-GAP-like repeat-containing protein [Stieleria tagensis]MCO8122302.1 FG-GAP-like repeat-containing protein [Stieleria tagensis]
MQRFLFRWATVHTIVFAVGCFIVGCDRDRTVETPDAELSVVGDKPVNAPLDDLALVKQLQQQADYKSATEVVYRVLLQDPENLEAKLLAAQVEAAQERLEPALEIVSSIPADSAMGLAAVDLQVKALVRLDRKSEAADVLLAAIKLRRDVPPWRHDAWRLLNHIGRRDEACAQAGMLCRMGLATEQELLSLISHSLSYPTPEMLKHAAVDSPTVDNPAADTQSEYDAETVEELFAAGLGRARWYFSLGDHQGGLDELADQAKGGFENPATDAFYGRLLAESQRWDELRQWNVQSSESAKQFSDYWAAVGTFFIDSRRYEAAARALLEAVRRNPTDRVSCQRLSKVFFSLGRADDGEQFRYRGVDIANTERVAQELHDAPGDVEKRKQLARYVMELGRPFETLAWTLTILPPGAHQARQAVAHQREDLLRDKSVAAMATETSLLSIDPDQFDLRPAWRELLAGKTDPGSKTPKSADARPIATTPRLVNRADEVGLHFQWYKDVEIDLSTIPIHESLGGGIAVLDYDLDGWPDVYLAQGSGDPPTDRCTRSNELFRNVTAKFISVTQPSNSADQNYSSGLTVGDVNQDGFPDLYLGALGHNRLLINNGDGTFRDSTAGLGDVLDRFSTSLAVADINGDALPDLFESNYIEMEGGFALPKTGPDGRLISPTPLSHYADSDRWFENLGDGRFQVHEITRQIAKPGTGLGVVVTDFESDGKNEVFVGNDVRPNHLLVQSGNNEFANVADSKGLANGFNGVANGCMGIATGDFNRDGKLDFQIANYSQEPANLFLQSSLGDFTDYSVRYGLAPPTHANVGFGTKAVDIDRNGFLDFIVTNGHIFDLRHEGEAYQMPPQLLMSDGRGLQQVNVEDESGYWMQTYLGRSIATLDYDRDGALDFLVGHLDQPLALLHDETNAAGGWLQVELVGTVSERDAIGAKLVLTVGQSQYSQWVTAGDGYFCNDESMISFALDQPQATGNLQVHWPSGGQQVFPAVPLGQRCLVVEGESDVQPRPSP